MRETARPFRQLAGVFDLLRGSARVLGGILLARRTLTQTSQGQDIGRPPGKRGSTPLPGGFSVFIDA